MTIQDYYRYSQLSALAYVNWRRRSGLTPEEAIEDANTAQRIPGDVNNPSINSLGDKIFSPTAVGGQGWQVAHFHPNDDQGFKASLFINSATGEKVLGVCGTEPKDNPYKDLIKADLQEIGDYGMAIYQAVSLFNYVQCLQAEKGDNSVLQLELQVDEYIPPVGNYVTVGFVPPRYLSVVASPTGTGLGLLDPDDNVTITGHSLGGHLAAIGQRLFPNLFDSTVTFNAPGFDPLVGVSTTPIGPIISLGARATDEFVNTLFAPYLSPPPLADFGNISVMVSEDSSPINDPSAVSSCLVTGTQPGPQQPITTERNSHMIEPLMDSLAVQALLEQLNPNIGLAGAGGVIQAASTNPGKSEEVVLDTLSEILLDSKFDRLANDPNDIAGGFWIEAGDFSKRTKNHERIIELENAIAGKNLSLEPLGTTDADGKFTQLSPNEIETKARSDIAYRYALVNLNPFAVLGADADYSRFNPNGELDLAGPADGQLSNSYLADRAEMLFNVIYANIHDTKVTDFETQYADLTKDIHLNKDVGANKKIAFGTDDGETLEGIDPESFFGDEKAGDHLYGMGGNDILRGYGGDDYLEGGEGQDTLLGGAGDDTFAVFGKDSAYDTFWGGEGYDSIKGGEGDDIIRVHQFSEANSIQIINGGAGNDTIAGTAEADTIDLSETKTIDIEQVDGGAGIDKLIGSQDADHLIGGEDNDTLQGGKGNDILEGGAGFDTYIINGTNRGQLSTIHKQELIGVNSPVRPGKVA
jgi:hypothetical protein